MMGCPAFWDDLRFNLQPGINMYNLKKQLRLWMHYFGFTSFQ